MTNKKPTAARVRALFDYEPDTGLLRRRIRAGHQMPGTVAGSIGSHGYYAVGVDGTRYLSHRIIWLHVTGYWPDQVDHVDLDRTNNRWCNLREATCSQNMANRTAHKDNKTGLKGVAFHKETGKWRARLYHDGQSISLGLHATPQLAAIAYDRFASQIHGEFARQS